MIKVNDQQLELSRCDRSRFVRWQKFLMDVSLFLATFVIGTSYNDRYGWCAESNIERVLQVCCTGGSYTGGDFRALSLKAPIEIHLFSWLHDVTLDPAPDYVQEMTRVLKEATRSDIIVNKPEPTEAKAMSGVDVSLLPSKMADLKPYQLEQIRHKFRLLDNTVTNSSGEKGVDGILNTLYSTDKNVLYSYRLKNGTRVSDVFEFAKPARDSYSPILVNRAIVEAFGYNSDNNEIDNTIFDEQGTSNLTNTDLSVIRYIYSQAR